MLSRTGTAELPNPVFYTASALPSIDEKRGIATERDPPWRGESGERIGLEADPQSKAELPLVDRLAADVVAGFRELGVAAEAPDRTVVIEYHIRTVPARSTEVRRVG